MSETSSLRERDPARPTRLSQSPLWQLQSRYYTAAGAEAWASGTVPHHVTSNPYIAGAYAKLVFGYLRDCVEGADRAGEGAAPSFPIDPAQPIHLVELGAGSGRFSLSFLRRFAEMMRRGSLAHLRWRYVLTDLVEGNVERLRARPELRPFVEAGLVDVARFEAGSDTALELRHCGERLGPGPLTNPLVVIANYIFDSLPADVFAVEDGAIHECFVRALVDGDPADMSELAVLQKLVLEYNRVPAGPAPLGDPALDAVLAGYAARLPSASIQFPTGALETVATLARLGGERLLLLSADKGYHRLEDVAERVPPQIVVHGSFSFSVNYHALAEWFRARGGSALFPSFAHDSILIAAFTLGAPPGGLIELPQAFDEAIEHGNPDDLHTVRRFIESRYADMSIEQLLALLRVTDYDHRVLGDVAPIFTERAPKLAPELANDVLQAVQRAFDGYLHIGEDHDIAFELGRLNYELGHDEQAIAFYRRSIEGHGSHRATHFNIALCLQRQGRAHEAIAAVRVALALDASYERAVLLEQQLAAELAQA